MKTSSFTSDFEGLPEQLQKQILDYIQFLQEKYVDMNKNAKGIKKVKLSDLKGLGKNVWKDVNIEKYIESERQWD
jgi:hypothetical protein